MSKNKKKDPEGLQPVDRPLLPESIRSLLNTRALLGLKVNAGIIAPIEVVASPVKEHTQNNPGTTVHPALVAFVASMNATEPKVARRSNDRVFNLNELHDALVQKFDAHFASKPGQTLGIDFEDPLAMLHRVDPDNPYRWIKINGSNRYGSNLYEVFMLDGTSQSIGIQYT